METLEKHACQIRHDIVDMIGYGEGRVGHLGGSCSIADIVSALYFHKIRHDPHNPKDPLRDRVLLSKGHAALAQYAALAECGYFPRETLLTVKRLGSKLQGHPDMTKTPGVEANTGSLGQGLSVGLGIALGLRADGIDRNVYVIMGDGEQAEGQIWEAAMAAAHYKADHLIGILDNNNLQSTGPLSGGVDPGDLAAKWAAFGWEVIEIDGHDMKQILAALDAADAVSGKPALILAHTVKGKGVDFAEGKAAFHNSALSQEQFEQAHRSIDAAFEGGLS